MKLLWICLLFLGCQPATEEDFQAEGRDWIRSFHEELKLIQTQEDLQKKLPFLTKKFNQLAYLMVQVRKSQDWDPLEDETEESRKLKQELERVYCIPGSKEIIELSQIKALQILDRGRK